MAKLEKALKADAAADEPVTVTLRGHDIRVLPWMDWSVEATEFAYQGRLAQWAEGAIHPDDLETFRSIKLTNRELIALVKDYSSDVGASPGESQPSQS